MVLSDGKHQVVPSFATSMSPLQGNLVHEAMAFVGNTIAYRRALQVCPHVVQTESPHDRYLERSQGNMWEAAERLANYWTLRAEILGDPGAFQPVMQALTSEEWEHLLEGQRAILPPDAAGRPVFFVDRQRLDKSCVSKNLRMRTFWFLFHLICHCQIYPNDEGFIMLFRIDMNNFAHKRMDRTMAELMQRMSTEAMCGGRRLQQFHFFVMNSPSGEAQGRYVRTALAKVLERISSWTAQLPSAIHVGNELEVVSSLEKHGIQRCYLPEGCGGDFSIQNDWPTQLERLTGRRFAKANRAPTSQVGSTPPLTSASMDLMSQGLPEGPADLAGTKRSWLSPSPLDMSFEQRYESNAMEGSAPFPASSSRLEAKKPRICEEECVDAYEPIPVDLGQNHLPPIEPIPVDLDQSRGHIVPCEQPRSVGMLSPGEFSATAAALFPVANSGAPRRLNPTVAGTMLSPAAERAARVSESLVSGAMLSTRRHQLEPEPFFVSGSSASTGSQVVPTSPRFSGTCIAEPIVNVPRMVSGDTHLSSPPLKPQRDQRSSSEGLMPMPMPMPELSMPNVFSGDLVHEAMAFAAKKDAYSQAVRLCPDVVKSESPHARYLDYCAGDMWSAAQRLACYWELRLEVFGQRAFLPLRDALTPDDWVFYRKNHRVILPPDSRGRPIALLDRVLLHSNIVRATPLDVRLRISFLYLQQCCDAAPDGNIVCMVRVDTTKFSVLRHDKQITDLARRAFGTAMCGKFVQCDYVLVDPPQTDPSQGLVRTLVFKVVQRMSQYIAGLPTVFHMGTPEQVKASLRDHGFSLQHLAIPQVGEFDSETEWPAWVDSQELTRGARRKEEREELSSAGAVGMTKSSTKIPPAGDWRPTGFGAERAAAPTVDAVSPSAGRPPHASKEVAALKTSRNRAAPCGGSDPYCVSRKSAPPKDRLDDAKQEGKSNDDICRSVEYTMEARRQKRRIQSLTYKRKKRESVKLARLKDHRSSSAP